MHGRPPNEKINSQGIRVTTHRNFYTGTTLRFHGRRTEGLGAPRIAVSVGGIDSRSGPKKIPSNHAALVCLHPSLLPVLSIPPCFQPSFFLRSYLAWPIPVLSACTLVSLSLSLSLFFTMAIYVSLSVSLSFFRFCLSASCAASLRQQIQRSKQ